jgi:hypothetical protein
MLVVRDLSDQVAPVVRGDGMVVAQEVTATLFMVAVAVEQVISGVKVVWHLV